MFIAGEIFQTCHPINSAVHFECISMTCIVCSRDLGCTKQLICDAVDLYEVFNDSPQNDAKTRLEKKVKRLAITQRKVPDRVVNE